MPEKKGNKIIVDYHIFWITGSDLHHVDPWVSELIFVSVIGNGSRRRRSVVKAPSSEVSVHYGYQVATWVLAVTCLGLGVALVAFAMRRKERELLMENTFWIDS